MIHCSSFAKVLTIFKLSGAIASAAISGMAIAARSAHAAPVTHDFTVNVTKGSLAGKSFRRDNRSSWRAVEGVLSKDRLYDDLRKFLITSGWRPAVTPEECKEGVGGGDPGKICDRRPEVEACSGGIRQCKMRFEHQESRVKLTVFTKAFPEGDRVTNWDIISPKSN